jgi:hypothetical protein
MPNPPSLPLIFNTARAAAHQNRRPHCPSQFRSLLLTKPPLQSTKSPP